MKTAIDMQRQLAKATQEQKDLALLDAIADLKGSKAVSACLDAGANPNCIGVPWYYGPSKETPLGLAVGIGCGSAVPILLAHGADPRGLTYSRNELIVEAVLKGRDDIVDALCKKSPPLVELLGSGGNANSLNGVTLLHRAILSMYPFSVIQDGVWESDEIRNTLIAYWDDLKDVEIPNKPLTVHYSGNLRTTRVLLNHHGRMMLIKSAEGISAWDIVSKPRDYQQYFYDFNGQKTIRRLSDADDPNPNVLTFEIDLSDRLGNKRFSETEAEGGVNRPLVRVVFDFTKLQNLIKQYAQRLPDFYLMEQVQSAVVAVKSTSQQQAQQIQSVQQRLSLVDRKQQSLSRPQEEQAQFQAWLNQPGHENLALFHWFIHSKLENVMLSFMASDGPAVDTNRGDQLKSIRTVLGVAGDAVSLVPLVGNPAQATFKLFYRAADKLAETRQKNKVADAADLLTLKPLMEQSYQLASKLTQAYAQQLRLLASPAEAQNQQSDVSRKIQRAKNAVTKGHFIPPAEQAAMFAMLWIIDQLYNANDIKQAVKDRGLDNVLFSMIVQKEPSDKLKTFWNKELQKALPSKGLLTKAGTFWDPQSFYSLPGIYVRETGQCYAHAMSDPDTYGWRLAPAEDVAKMPGCRLLEGVHPVLEGSWFGGHTLATTSSSGHSSDKSSNSSPEHRPAIVPAYEGARAKPVVLVPAINNREVSTNLEPRRGLAFS